MTNDLMTIVAIGADYNPTLQLVRSIERSSASSPKNSRFSRFQVPGSETYASYMVIVPNLVTDAAPLARNPVFLYYSDQFTQPQAFRPDIVVSIDDVFDDKINMLDAHVSQFYQWLPWTMGQLQLVPKLPAERKRWLATQPLAAREIQTDWREALDKRYGVRAARIQHAEAFEITEYGRQPSEAEIRQLFPFFP